MVHFLLISCHGLTIQLSVRGDGSSEWYNVFSLSRLTLVSCLTYPVLGFHRINQRNCHVLGLVTEHAECAYLFWLRLTQNDVTLMTTCFNTGLLILQTCKRTPTPKVALEMSFRHHQRLELSWSSSSCACNTGLQNQIQIYFVSI